MGELLLMKKDEIAQRENFWRWFHQVRGHISVSQVEERAGAKRGLLTNASGNLRGTITQKIIEAIADGLEMDRRKVYDKYLACIEYEPPGQPRLPGPDQVLQEVWNYIQHPPVIAERHMPYYTGPQAKLVGLYDRLELSRQQQLISFAQFLAITQNYDLSNQIADLMSGSTSGDLDHLFEKMIQVLKNAGDEEHKT